MSRLNRNFIFVSAGALILAFFYAFLSHRPMLGEGSTWYLHVLTHHKPFFDPVFFRFSDRLLQYPTILLLKLGLSNQVGIYLLSFFYSMHPLLSLIFCWWFLEKKNRLELIYFPILSLVAATLPTLPLATGMAPDVLSIFWPVFFLVLLGDQRSLKDKLITISLLFALVFSYEPALLLFLVIALVAGLRWLMKSDRSKFNILIFAFSIFSVCYFIFMIQRTPPEILDKHSSWIFQQYDVFRIFGFFSFILFFLSAILSFQNQVFRRILNLFWIVLFSWFLYRFSNFDLGENMFTGIGPTSAFPARTTAVPVATLIGLSAVLHYFFSSPRYRLFVSEKLNVSTHLICGIVLFGALCDAKTTLFWNQGLNYVKNVLVDKKGCDSIPIEEFAKKILPSSIPDFSIAALSISIQIIDGKNEIEKVVFTDHYFPNATGRNACEYFDGEKIQNNQGAFVYFQPSHIRYSKNLIDELKNRAQ